MDRGLGPQPIGRHRSSPGRGPILWQRVRLWTPVTGVGLCSFDYSLSAMASEKPQDLVVTCTAPVNIAVIKYCECWNQGSHPGWDRGVGLEAGVITGIRSPWAGGPRSRVAELENRIIPAG